jgi:hypothetical protein
MTRSLIIQLYIWIPDADWLIAISYSQYYPGNGCYQFHLNHSYTSTVPQPSQEMYQLISTVPQPSQAIYKLISTVPQPSQAIYKLISTVPQPSQEMYQLISTGKKHIVQSSGQLLAGY